MPSWNPEVIRLADKYRKEGVVGVDLAGDELYGAFFFSNFLMRLRLPLEPHIEAFQQAKYAIARRLIPERVENWV
jgi:hypothetical protein